MTNINKLRELLDASTSGPWTGVLNPGIGVSFPDLTWSGNHGDYWKLPDAQLIITMRNCAEEWLAVVEAAEVVESEHGLLVLKRALVALNTKLGEGK